MKRTNIMLTDNQHKEMKAYAKKEGRTVGELVRSALDAVYRERDAVEHRKAVAIEAYNECLISLGRLAEILGMDAVTLRLYLKEQGLSLKVQEQQELLRDAGNA